MILFKRRRLIFWLIKAYVKKLWKIILVYFAIGLAVFFIFGIVFKLITAKFPFMKTDSIGVIGAYTIDNIPQDILYNASYGLTSIALDGTARNAAAKSWKIENNGKTYIFYLRHDIYFSDRTKLTSDQIDYGFSDVSVKRPDKYTISFTLKTPYSPFLLTVSRPIFKQGLVGIGDYSIKKISLDGSFVESLQMVSTKYNKTLVYQFYPTEKALKTAFLLTEVSSISGLSNDQFENKDLSSFRRNNIIVIKSPNYDRLVTLFYNVSDKTISSKTLREALSYTIPDFFTEGERNSSPFPPYSFVNRTGTEKNYQDIEHAKTLLAEVKTDQNSKNISIVISTLPQYQTTAEEIAFVWRDVGINVKIKTVYEIPTSYQVFLGDFRPSKDPDQYVLWHSNQINNITHYNDMRIDKLLEDGREESDINQRIETYTDFQKYLLADPPASFLYFPYTYSISRR